MLRRDSESGPSKGPRMLMIALLTRALVALVALPAADAVADATKVAVRSPDRVYYLFSPDAVEQRQRAERMQRLLHDRPLVVIARGPWGMENPAVVAAVAVVGAPDFPAFLKERLDAESDYFALWDAGRWRTGSGRDLEDLVAANIATEVDESTWGKVKDLFK